jgi:hypothetical protein
MSGKLGKVTVNALNLMQGEFPDIEKYFLFVGVGPAHVGELVFLSTDSDLDVELGAAASDLKTQITAARLNAGQNWACVAAPVASGTDWEDAVDLAMNQDVRVEAVIICTPVTLQAEITALHAKAIEINTEFGRRLFFLAAGRAIDPTPSTGDTWNDYIADMNTLTDEVSAYRVGLVPQIFPDALGIYAGRLCNDQVSIADSPMRVRTGALVGRDASQLAVDNTGVRYNNAHALALLNARCTVPQLYADYPGVYWADGTMLDVTAGDYEVIENLRVVDKAARRVRIVLIGMIADRSFNASPIGTAYAKNKLMRPLMEMAKSYVFQGIPFPAEIKPPKDTDIGINWITRTQVEIYLTTRPFESPKEITANIILDLSAPTA